MAILHVIARYIFLINALLIKNSLPAEGILLILNNLSIPNLEQHHSILYWC